MTQSEIATAIEACWSIETTYCVENYINRDPAWGNCAVTALLVQELLGGELMQGWAIEPGQARTAHYWNRVSGYDLDLTWRQFVQGTILTDTALADYNVLIENEWMRERYENLVAAFCHCIQQMQEAPREDGKLATALGLRTESWVLRSISVLRGFRSVPSAG